MKSTPFPTWVEIEKKALLHNVRSLKKILPSKSKGMFVIKSNAYGHGLPEVISILKNEKAVDVFGVFSFSDALFVRKFTKKPILVLSTLQKEWVKDAVKNDIELTISRFDQLEYLKRIKLTKKLKVHLKVDTGLGRQGFLKDDMQKVAVFIYNLKTITLTGLYSHLSGAESRYFDSYTMNQYTNLLEWENSLLLVGLKPIVHLSATSGVIRMSDLACGMVRFGIGTYGLWPGEETALADKGKTILKPVLSWKTTIVEVKELPPGSYIAYDCTCQVARKTKIAVLPVGYWDGLPRQASNRAWVLIKGKKCRLLGRVMMNMCVVDVTGIPSVKTGDVAVFVGKDKRENISAEMLAQAADTINYEIITRINPLLPRVIT